MECILYFIAGILISILYLKFFYFKKPEKYESYKNFILSNPTEISHYLQNAWVLATDKINTDYTVTTLDNNRIGYENLIVAINQAIRISKKLEEGKMAHE